MARVVTIIDLSALEQNAKVREDARTELAKLIVAARRDAWPWPAIARAAKLSRVSVMEIARQANGGELPQPRQREAK